jgi:hypothetical protein
MREQLKLHKQFLRDKEELERHINKKGIALIRSLFLALACTMAVFAFSYQPKYEVVTEHNVAILEQLNDGDFAYKSDEKPEGDIYRPCEIDRKHGIDVTGMLRQAIGYVADKATWQERGTCKSILRPEWQFWFRDANNSFTYVRVK